MGSCNRRSFYGLQQLSSVDYFLSINFDKIVDSCYGFSHGVYIYNYLAHAEMTEVSAMRSPEPVQSTEPE